jgi:zinc finger protein
MQETIGAAREGAVPFTVIIEDPSGNSMLVSEKAEKMLLDQGET